MSRKIVRTTTPPAGLSYFPNFLSGDEEEAFLEILKSLEYYDFVLQGYVAKRKVKHYGFAYEFYSESVKATEPFPDWLATLRDRAAPLAGLQ